MNISTVINIPSELVSREFLYFPIIFLLFEIKIININNGGASTAFNAAEYINIRNGLIPKKLTNNPAIVATAITA